MLRDFAIDPDALTSWVNCRAILDRFVMGSGALISEYPKHWRRMAYESASRQCKDMELKRITERLDAINRSLLIPSRRVYPESDETWFSKASEVHQRQPFGGVICSDDSNASPELNVISTSEVNVTNPLFADLGQAHVARNSNDMAQTIRLLLVDARHVKFVDTHYKPGSHAGFDEPVRQILRQIQHDGARTIRVELHTENSDRRPTEDILESGFVAVVRAVIPNAEIAVVFYDQGQLHNRFVLTDKGGVMCGTGLDEQGDSERKTKSDDLFLLNEKMYRLHWDKWNAS